MNLKTIQGHNTIVFCRSGLVQVGDSTETMKPAQIGSPPPSLSSFLLPIFSATYSNHANMPALYPLLLLCHSSYTALLSYDGDGIQLRTQSEGAVLMILGTFFSTYHHIIPFYYTRLPHSFNTFSPHIFLTKPRIHPNNSHTSILHLRHPLTFA